MFIKILHNNWQFRQSNETEWLDAEIPGSVHTDLLRLGLIDDPFIGDNEKTSQWISEKSWEYKSVFDVEEDERWFRSGSCYV